MAEVNSELCIKLSFIDKTFTQRISTQDQTQKDLKYSLYLRYSPRSQEMGALNKQKKKKNN